MKVVKVDDIIVSEKESSPDDTTVESTTEAKHESTMMDIENGDSASDATASADEEENVSSAEDTDDAGSRSGSDSTPDSAEVPASSPSEDSDPANPLSSSDRAAVQAAINENMREFASTYDIGLLPNVGAKRAKTLRSKGINNYLDLMDLTEDQIDALDRETSGTSIADLKEVAVDFLRSMCEVVPRGGSRRSRSASGRRPRSSSMSSAGKPASKKRGSKSADSKKKKKKKADTSSAKKKKTNRAATQSTKQKVAHSTDSSTLPSMTSSVAVLKPKAKIYDFSVSECFSVLEMGQVVWGKLKGYPWWPAQVVREWSLGKLVCEDDDDDDNLIPIRFFGTGDDYVIDIDDLEEFAGSFSKNTRIKQTKLLSQSINIAKDTLDEQGAMYNLCGDARQRTLEILGALTIPAEEWVGKFIKTYWTLDDAWYMGRVLRYNEENQRLFILYADGGVEWVSLSAEKFKSTERIEGFPDPVLEEDEADQCWVCHEECVAGKSVRSSKQSEGDSPSPVEGEVLPCENCSRTCHHSCVIKVVDPQSATTSVPKVRCPSCVKCHYCYRDHPPSARATASRSGDFSDSLIVCDICDKHVHMECIDPPIKTQPADGWICDECVVCKHCHSRHASKAQEAIANDQRSRNAALWALTGKDGKKTNNTSTNGTNQNSSSSSSSASSSSPSKSTKSSSKKSSKRDGKPASKMSKKDKQRKGSVSRGQSPEAKAPVDFTGGPFTAKDVDDIVALSQEGRVSEALGLDLDQWAYGYTTCQECVVQFLRRSYCQVCMLAFDDDARPDSMRPMVCCDKCDFWVHYGCDPSLSAIVENQESIDEGHSSSSNKMDVDEDGNEIIDVYTPGGAASSSSGKVVVPDAVHSKKYECVNCVTTTKAHDLSHLLDRLVNEDKQSYFVEPVTDDIAPGYSLVIKTPMDFSSIRRKLVRRAYGHSNFEEAFKHDLNLVWRNAKDFNPPRAPVYQAAERLQNLSIEMFVQLQEELSTRQSGFYVEEEPEDVTLLEPWDPEYSPQLIPSWFELYREFVISATMHLVDTCFLCGCAGDWEFFLCCVDCGEAFHTFCLSHDIPVNDARRKGWRCSNCVLCTKCKKTNDSVEMLVCDDCDSGIHLSCVRPAISSIPQGAFKCDSCAKCVSCGKRSPGKDPGARWMDEYTHCYTCYNAIKRGDYCPICSCAWDETATDMVECDCCKFWIHSKCDPSLQDLSQVNDALYHCPGCRSLSEEGRKEVTDRLAAEEEAKRAAAEKKRLQSEKKKERAKERAAAKAAAKLKKEKDEEQRLRLKEEKKRKKQELKEKKEREKREKKKLKKEKKVKKVKEEPIEVKMDVIGSKRQKMSDVLDNPDIFIATPAGKQGGKPRGGRYKPNSVYGCPFCASTYCTARKDLREHLKEVHSEMGIRLIGRALRATQRLEWKVADERRWDFVAGEYANMQAVVYDIQCARQIEKMRTLTRSIQLTRKSTWMSTATESLRAAQVPISPTSSLVLNNVAIPAQDLPPAGESSSSHQHQEPAQQHSTMQPISTSSSSAYSSSGVLPSPVAHVQSPANMSNQVFAMQDAAGNTILLRPQTHVPLQVLQQVQPLLQQQRMQQQQFVAQGVNFASPITPIASSSPRAPALTFQSTMSPAVAQMKKRVSALKQNLAASQQLREEAQLIEEDIISVQKSVEHLIQNFRVRVIDYALRAQSDATPLPAGKEAPKLSDIMLHTIPQASSIIRRRSSKQAAQTRDQLVRVLGLCKENFEQLKSYTEEVLSHLPDSVPVYEAFVTVFEMRCNFITNLFNMTVRSFKEWERELRQIDSRLQDTLRTELGKAHADQAKAVAEEVEKGTRQQQALMNSSNSSSTADTFGLTEEEQSITRQRPHASLLMTSGKIINTDGAGNVISVTEPSPVTRKDSGKGEADEGANSTSVKVESAPPPIPVSSVSSSSKSSSKMDVEESVVSSTPSSAFRHTQPALLTVDTSDAHTGVTGIKTHPVPVSQVTQEGNAASSTAAPSAKSIGGKRKSAPSDLDALVKEAEQEKLVESKQGDEKNSGDEKGLVVKAADKKAATSTGKDDVAMEVEPQSTSQSQKHDDEAAAVKAVMELGGLFGALRGESMDIEKSKSKSAVSSSSSSKAEASVHDDGMNGDERNAADALLLSNIAESAAAQSREGGKRKAVDTLEGEEQVSPSGENDDEDEGETGSKRKSSKKGDGKSKSRKLKKPAIPYEEKLRAALERIAAEQARFRSIKVACPALHFESVTSLETASCPPGANSTTIDQLPTSTAVVPSLGGESGLHSSTSSLPLDDRACALCHRFGDEDEFLRGCGRLMNFTMGSQPMWVHSQCAIWSSMTYEKVSPFVLEQGGLDYIQNTVKQALLDDCVICGRNGASVYCCDSRCSKKYHYPCAIDAGVQFVTGSRTFCPEDQLKQPPHTVEVDDFDRMPPVERLYRRMFIHQDQASPHNGHSEKWVENAFVIEWCRDNSKRCIAGEEDWESFPKLRLGALSVQRVGVIQPELPAFSNQHFLFPVGYRAYRLSWSYKDSKARVLYTCEIRRGTYRDVPDDLLDVASSDDEEEKHSDRDVDDDMDMGMDDDENTEDDLGSIAETLDALSSSSSKKKRKTSKSPAKSKAQSGKKKGGKKAVKGKKGSAAGKKHTASAKKSQKAASKGRKSSKKAGKTSSKKKKKELEKKERKRRKPKRSELNMNAEVPLFVLTASDDPLNPIIASSAAKAWVSLVQRWNGFQSRNLRRSKYDETGEFKAYGLNGGHFFGFGHPVVQALLERIPAAWDCKRYPLKYYDPTEEIEARRIEEERKREELQAETVALPENESGCARTEGFVRQGHYGQVRQVHNVTPSRSWVTEKGFVAHVTHFEEHDTTGAVPSAGGVRSSKSGATSSDSSISAQYRVLVNTPPHLLPCVRRSPIHAWGLYATYDIPAGVMIIEYVGERVRQSVADMREKQYEQEGLGSCYMFRLGPDLIVDSTKKGNAARFLNHCCDPNAYTKLISVDGEEHVVIISKRDIQMGEEITADYQFASEDEKIACHCGAPNCSGRLN